MAKFTINKNKHKNLSKPELVQLSKEELADKIIQLEAHIFQLKNIITRNDDCRESSDSSLKKRKTFDFTQHKTRRIFLRIAYFGEKYNGFVTQEDSTNTIEHYLFMALKKAQLILSRETANYHRCGRTDKGVSATGQVISLTVRSRLSEDEIQTKSNMEKELPYCQILNRLLPDNIRAISWVPIGNKQNGDSFSARFDCKYRTYKYWFPKYIFNIEAMREGCKYLEGTHDFRNFCKMDVGNGVTSFMRHIYSALIVREKNSVIVDDEYSLYYLCITGNAFLWHQIRCIVSVLFLIGNNKEDPCIIKKLLDADSNPRKPQYNLAIETPLNLVHCSYKAWDSNRKLVSDSEKKQDDDFLTNKKCVSSEVNENTSDGKDNNENLNYDLWQIDADNLTDVIKCYHKQWMTSSIQTSLVKDIINELFALYYEKFIKTQSSSNTLKEMSDEICIIEARNKLKDCIFKDDFLIQGVKSKTYVPLLKRPKCEALEDRINHYLKKKRIKESNIETSIE